MGKLESRIEIDTRTVHFYRSPKLRAVGVPDPWWASFGSTRKFGCCHSGLARHFNVRKSDVITICVAAEPVADAVEYVGIVRLGVCQELGLADTVPHRVWWWVEIEPR